MRWIPLLLLAGCGGMDVPLPERCQQVGVAVADNDTITGTILEDHKLRRDEMQRVKDMCRVPFREKDFFGCAIPVNEHEYIIWYLDYPEVRDEERCHALYEEKRHNG